MTRDDIIRMARRYGCVIAEDGPDSQCEVSFSADQLLALLQFVAVAEREACAKVCEEDLRDEYLRQDRPVQDEVNLLAAIADCAAVIRARGQA